MPPRSRLKIPDPHEISLVRRGANLKKFLVHKSDDGDAPAASEVLEQLIAKADKQGDDEPPAFAKKPKGKPKAPADGDAPPGEAEESEESDAADEAPAKVIKTEDLDTDRLWLLEFVAKELGAETREAILKGHELTAPPAPTEDQAWVMIEVHKAFGRSFPPPRPQPNQRMAQAMARQAPPLYPAPPQPPPPAPVPAAAPAVPHPQAQVPMVQQGAAPPVSPALDLSQPQLAGQLPMAAGGGLSSPAQDALKACARILAPHKDEVSSADVGGMLEAIGIPINEAPDAEDLADDGDDEAEEDDSGQDNAAALLLQQQVKQGQNLDGKPEYVALSLEGKTHHDEVEPMDLSAFPPAQRTQMETVLKSLAADANKELVAKSEAWDKERKELVEKAEAVQKRLDEEHDQRIMKEYVAKAAEFTHLGADTQKLAKVLKAVESADPELRKDLEAVLKGVNGQLEVADETGSLMGEAGSRQAGRGGSAAQAKLDQLVDGYVAKDGEGTLSRQQKAARILKTAEGRKIAREIDLENERTKRRFGQA